MNDQERLLIIFLRLQTGAHLSKKQLAAEFGVSEKTIQRDLALLRDFLPTQFIIPGELTYSRKTQGYQIKGKSLFNKKDILVIAKILLENRALNEEENSALLNSLLGLVSLEDKKEIKTIIASELLNYAPIREQQYRIEKIWDWSEAIRYEKVMDISYRSPYTDKAKAHTVLPVSLYYDSHYFYLVAYNLKYENYMTLKLDRIKSWKPSIQPRPVIDHKDKFRDGDIRSQHVDAFLGPKITLELSFKYDPSIVLDQFPKSKIISSQDGWTQFKIKSQYTPGLKRWLLSQGEAVQLLAPQYLVDDIQETLKEMMGYYK